MAIISFLAKAQMSGEFTFNATGENNSTRFTGSGVRIRERNHSCELIARGATNDDCYAGFLLQNGSSGVELFSRLFVHTHKGYFYPTTLEKGEPVEIIHNPPLPVPAAVRLDTVTPLAQLVLPPTPAPTKPPEDMGFVAQFEQMIIMAQELGMAHEEVARINSEVDSLEGDITKLNSDIAKLSGELKIKMGMKDKLTTERSQLNSIINSEPHKKARELIAKSREIKL